MRELAADILNRKKFVWLSGRIKYTDVFKGEHVTPFWHRYNPSGENLTLESTGTTEEQAFEAAFAGSKCQILSTSTNSFEPWDDPVHNRRT
jgi:hypothetical protein